VSHVLDEVRAPQQLTARRDGGEDADGGVAARGAASRTIV
jgi:hypothetical protein